MAKKLYFEQFNWGCLPIAVVGHMLGWEMAAFDTDLKLRQKRFVGFVIERGWVQRVVAHHYAFGISHTRAIEAAELIVDRMSDHPALKTMVGLYGDDEVLLVFKKALAEELVVLTSMQAYLHRVSASSMTSVWLMPGRYCALMNLLKGYGIDDSFPSTVKVVGKGIGSRFVSLLAGLAGWVLVLGGYFVHLLAQWVRKPCVAKDHLKYGISLPSPWFEKFRGGPREFTFLIDDKILHRDDAAFLIEYPNSKSFYDTYQDQGYHLFPAIRPGKLSHLFEASMLNAGDELRYLPALLLYSWRSSFIREAVGCMLVTRLTWGRMLARVRFDHYVYCNKESKGQVAANIFFRKNKIMSWNYSQFVGGPYQVDGPNTPFDSRNVYWSFLNSDYSMLNCEAMVESMRKQHQTVRHYNIIGNIFAEMIDRADVKHLRSRFGLAGGEGSGQQRASKVAAVFDTSYVDVESSYSCFEEAASFLDDCIKLAGERPEVTFLFKPSKDNAYFIAPDGIWSSPIKGGVVVKLRALLASLPNVVFLQDSDDPVEVIAVSDVVITNCFSSPTADAVSAGIPAFWYDAKESVRGYPLDQVQGLVAHGYHELVRQFDAALSGPGFLKQLNDQALFRNMVNDFSDYRALNRLRRVLLEQGPEVT